MKKLQIFQKMFLLFTVLLLFSCTASRELNQIFVPEVLQRSPNLDFMKVESMAIMPLNCYSNEIPELTGLINDGLPAELKRSQTAWDVLGYDEVLRKVNDAGLGRGYQNYIADLNTYVSVAGMTPNFTSETKLFFDKLSKEMNFEAVLFTSYGFSERTEMRRNSALTIIAYWSKTSSSNYEKAKCFSRSF